MNEEINEMNVEREKSGGKGQNMKKGRKRGRNKKPNPKKETTIKERATTGCLPAASSPIILPNISNNATTATNIARIRYSLDKNAMAPSLIYPAISFILSVPSL